MKRYYTILHRIKLYVAEGKHKKNLQRCTVFYIVLY